MEQQYEEQQEEAGNKWDERSNNDEAVDERDLIPDYIID